MTKIIYPHQPIIILGTGLKVGWIMKFTLSMWILLVVVPVMFINLHVMTLYGPAWETPEVFYWQILTILGILGEVLSISSVIEYMRSRIEERENPQ